MAQHTEQEREDWKRCFRRFDQDGNGCITAHELANVLRGMGLNPTNAEVTEMIKSMDPNGDGKIEYREFENHMSKNKYKNWTDQADEMRAAFRVFDRDNNGSISAAELRHAMTQFGEPLTQEEAESMIEIADVNRDGVIKYDEFVKMLTKKS